MGPQLKNSPTSSEHPLYERYIRKQSSSFMVHQGDDNNGNDGTERFTRRQDGTVVPSRRRINSPLIRAVAPRCQNGQNLPRSSRPAVKLYPDRPVPVLPSPRPIILPLVLQYYIFCPSKMSSDNRCYGRPSTSSTSTSEINYS